MRALSVKQPWANLILSGKKTIETRTRNTNFRGDFLLVSSKEPDKNALQNIPNAKAGLCGYALAIVTLKNSRPMCKQDEKAACCPIYPDAHAWELENVRQLANPFPVKGNLGFYEVSDNLIEQAQTTAEIELDDFKRMGNAI